MFKNKNLIIAIVVVVLLLAGLGFYIFSKSAKTVAPTEKTTVTEPKASPSSITGTIKDLLTGGKTQSCTITYPNNTGSGTIFVSGKKFGGDFTIKDADGKETTGHMISDGTYMYIWSTATPMGIKMKLDTVTNAAEKTQGGSIDVNEKVNLNCVPWTSDESKFIVPTNIKFQDMTSLIPNSSTKPNSTTETQTQNGNSICDQITDPTGKAACLNALSGEK